MTNFKAITIAGIIVLAVLLGSFFITASGISKINQSVVGLENSFGDLAEQVKGSASQNFGGFSHTQGSFAVAGDLTVAGAATFSGQIGYLKLSENITASTTITIADSGKTYFLSGDMATMTLPATSTVGTLYRFVIGGAITGNQIITTIDGSSGIEGTLIVAGAVVDCDAEDSLNFVADGENVGDYVELYSDGTQWLLGDSGVLTSAKLTCTAT